MKKIYFYLMETISLLHTRKFMLDMPNPGGFSNEHSRKMSSKDGGPGVV